MAKQKNVWKPKADPSPKLTDYANPVKLGRGIKRGAPHLLPAICFLVVIVAAVAAKVTVQMLFGR